ncbi:MAG: tetratricopeptide repeat protein [Sedimentisphaerales bacterium]|nr:tetratricopeptide repeat protein [Sedimentisphaerales bacterium]
MTKTTALSVLATLAAMLLWAAGCGPKPTSIRLIQPIDPGLLARERIVVPVVGSFQVDPSEYADYGGVLSGYLEEHLARFRTELQGQAADSPPPAAAEPLRIQGRIRLGKSPVPATAQTAPVRIQVIFQLRDVKRDLTMQSVTFESAAASAEPAEVRPVLQKAAGQYLRQLLPREVVIESVLAVGHSDYDRRGRRAVRDGRYREALDYFRQAVDAIPDDHAALYNAGLVSEYLQEYPRARQFYQRAMRISDAPEYRIAYHRVLQLMAPAPDDSARTEPIRP